MVLYAAIRQHGSPEALVSDGGSIFRAKQAMAIYRALGIQKEQIAKRQAWQSYIETTFNVQRRMADWHFAQAKSWAELLAAHDRATAAVDAERGGVAQGAAAADLCASASTPCCGAPIPLVP